MTSHCNTLMTSQYSISLQDINVKQNALHSGYMTLVKNKIIRRKVFVSLTEKGLEMSKRRDGPVEGTGYSWLCIFWLEF